MEKEKATEVTCPSCQDNENVKNVQTTVFLIGGSLLFLSFYGLVSMILDIVSLF